MTMNGTRDFTLPRASDSRSLSEFLDEQVYPRLTPEQVYSHPAHRFHRNGVKMRGGCPWHDSSSGTSFVVDLKTLSWYDAGCLIGGGPLQYLHRLDGGDGHLRGEAFITYARRAAEMAGIPFPEREMSDEERDRARAQEVRRSILDVVNHLAVERLWSTVGADARAYLEFERGCSEDAIRALGIGLYPEPQALADALKAHGIAHRDIAESGVMRQGSGALWNYITIPWSDAYERPLKIYGRAVGDPPEGRPKTTALPGEGSKRSPLYFDRARREHCTHLVLVEGLLDAVIAQAHGDSRVVACVAAQLSHAQVDTLRRHRVDAVTICLDPDSAGDAGIRSCINSLSEAGITPFVAPKLPRGMDPDSFILNEGIDAWRAHIDASVHGFRHMARMFVGAGASTDAQRAQIVKDANAFATTHTARDTELQTFFWPEISETLGMQDGFVSSVSAPGEHADAHEWGDREPLPALLPSVPALPVDLVPESLRMWLTDIADRAAIPLEYVAAPAIVAIGSVLGRKVGIRPSQYDDFTVVANLWGGIIGRPGWMKSHAISEPLRPLFRLEHEARDAFKRESQQAVARAELLQATITGLKQAIAGAAKKNSDLGDLELQLAAARAELDELTVIERRYTSQDATVEKLGEMLAENPNGLMVLRDELAGWIRQLDRPGSEGNREFYLESWNGNGSYTFDRIGRGTIHIPAVTVSILGGIQPGKLSATIRGALSDGIGADGLLQRLQVTVWPDRLGEWKQVTSWPNKNAREQAYQVFKALDTLDVAAIGADLNDGAIPFLRFDQAAQSVYDEWRADLERRLRSDELADSPAFESHLSKYRSLMPSLALLFHLIDVAGGQRPAAVSEQATRLAASWCEYLELHARKIYAPELRANLDAAHALAQKIEAGAVVDGASVRDLYRAQWAGLGSPDRVFAAITILEQHGWLRVDKRMTDGRPSDVIRLHPDLRGDTNG